MRRSPRRRAFPAFLTLILVALTLTSPLFFASPADAADVEPPTVNAPVDFTSAANVWWTTSITGSGANDSTSFANRAPWSNLGSVTIRASDNLTIVLEGTTLTNGTGTTAGMVLGNGQVAAKTFTCYGGLYVVDSTNTFPGPENPSAIRCAIGGTVGQKSGATTLWGPNIISNVDWGGEPDGDTATTGIIYTQGNLYWYNCTAKITGNYVLYTNGANTVLELCALTSSYGIYKQYGDITLIACTITASQAGGYWMNVIQSSDMRIVSGITLAGAGATSINLVANARLGVHFYRRAFLKITSDGTTPISGAAYSAYEATGGVDMPLSSGVTAADGLCDVPSPTTYNQGIWALQKVETYIRTTAGAMTWGTPTYTNTYGAYTFTFSKSGYDTATYTRTMTTDWGSAADYTEITLNATDAALTNFAVYSYTSAAGTTRSTEYFRGDNIYADATSTCDIANTAWMEVSCYRVGTPDTLILTHINKAYAFTSSSQTNLLTAANTTRPVFHTTTTTAPGNYYWYMKVNGTFVHSTTIRSYFYIDYAWPTLDSITISAAVVTQGDPLWINGTGNFTDGAIASFWMSGFPCAANNATVAGWSWSIEVNTSALPPGDYAAGEIVVYLVNTSASGFVITDATLTLHVDQGAVAPAAPGAGPIGGGYVTPSTAPPSNASRPWYANITTALGAAENWLMEEGGWAWLIFVPVIIIIGYLILRRNHDKIQKEAKRLIK